MKSMKKIELRSLDSETTYELHAYRAGESVTVFKGTTGTLGHAAGSKTAGIVYVEKGPHGTTADDIAVDDASLWTWIQGWTQKGLDAERETLKRVLESSRQQTAEDMKQLELDALRQQVRELEACNTVLNERCERAEKRVAELRAGLTKLETAASFAAGQAWKTPFWQPLAEAIQSARKTLTLKP